MHRKLFWYSFRGETKLKEHIGTEYNKMIGKHKLKNLEEKCHLPED
jgi:hypothetical protein